MKAITKEWISKAEDDWNAAGILYRHRKHPNYDGACFHTQQCVEKYFKARLDEAGVAFGKTHDLAKLLSQAIVVEPTWSVLHQDAIFLTDFAVDYRYPGSSTTKPEAREALKRCANVRIVVRKTFGLKF